MEKTWVKLTLTCLHVVQAFDDRVRVPASLCTTFDEELMGGIMIH